MVYLFSTVPSNEARTGWYPQDHRSNRIYGHFLDLQRAFHKAWKKYQITQELEFSAKFR